MLPALEAVQSSTKGLTRFAIGSTNTRQKNNNTGGEGTQPQRILPNQGIIVSVGNRYITGDWRQCRVIPASIVGGPLCCHTWNMITTQFDQRLLSREHRQIRSSRAFWVEVFARTISATGLDMVPLGGSSCSQQSLFCRTLIEYTNCPSSSLGISSFPILVGGRCWVFVSSVVVV